MLYVLRCHLGGPPSYTEYSYDEVIEVKNKIATCKNETSLDFLLKWGYDLLGQIEDESQLSSFLASLDDPTLTIDPPKPPVETIPLSAVKTPARAEVKSPPKYTGSEPRKNWYEEEGE